MKLRVYTIYDRVAEEYGPVFQAKTDGVAVRSARHALRQAVLSDYRLCWVGEFDSDTGVLEGMLPAEVNLAKGDSIDGDV